MCTVCGGVIKFMAHWSFVRHSVQQWQWQWKSPWLYYLNYVYVYNIYM